MARCLTGGTRGFIRGKVASDLYQVTRDARGRKVQLIRSVEESRVNPNTIEQAIARMNMAMCMGSLSQFKEIVDHSFEGVPYGQLSIAHFVKRNIPLIQTDEKEHWEDGNLFDYPTKGESVIRAGAWLMSEGSLQLPSIIHTTTTNASYYPTSLVIDLQHPYARFRDLKAALGANAGDYITVILFGVTYPSSFNRILYRRFYLAQDVPDDTLITSSNANSMFTYDGNTTHTLNYYQNYGAFNFHLSTATANGTLNAIQKCIIISKWNGKVWQRNTSSFEMTRADIVTEDYLQRPMDVFESWYEDWDGNNPFE